MSRRSHHSGESSGSHADVDVPVAQDPQQRFSISCILGLDTRTSTSSSSHSIFHLGPVCSSSSPESSYNTLLTPSSPIDGHNESRMSTTQNDNHYSRGRSPVEIERSSPMDELSKATSSPYRSPRDTSSPCISEGGMMEDEEDDEDLEDTVSSMENRHMFSAFVRPTPLHPRGAVDNTSPSSTFLTQDLGLGSHVGVSAPLAPVWYPPWVAAFKPMFGLQGN